MTTADFLRRRITVVRRHTVGWGGHRILVENIFQESRTRLAFEAGARERMTTGGMDLDTLALRLHASKIFTGIEHKAVLMER